MTFGTLLVANRGEIAVRVIATAKRLGLETVAVYSDADRGSAHVDAADRAVRIGGPAPADSYLRTEAVLEAAAATGAGAIHPGYGFLSENAAFAEAVEAAGLAFVGPSPNTWSCSAPSTPHAPPPRTPGSRSCPAPACSRASKRPWPRPTASATRSCSRPPGRRRDRHAARREPRGAARGVGRVRRVAETGFGHAGLFLERQVRRARHVEAQVFGDGRGEVAVIGDRDCSLQRRNQKVIEEAPAPNLPAHLRRSMHKAARRLCASVGYRSAGTVEFLYDTERDEVSFLEVNTRLQVEHPVTEAVFGIDLVEWMIRLAQEDISMMRYSLEPSGHAVQTRLYAEDPASTTGPPPASSRTCACPNGSGSTPGSNRAPRSDRTTTP
ncbi:acetyl-CoA carboxylase biotin carboxylase subunit [Glycomyces albus]